MSGTHFATLLAMAIVWLVAVPGGGIWLWRCGSGPTARTIGKLLIAYVVMVLIAGAMGAFGAFVAMRR